jgi:hypothetical protein
MKIITRVLILVFLCASLGLAQRAYLYTNTSTDGTNIYLSGVIQADGWYLSYGATHTYSQYLRLTSPTGRSSSCSFNSPQPASQSAYYQCQTALSLTNYAGSSEPGDYAIGGYQQAVCSQAGLFAFASLATSIHVVVSLTGYNRVPYSIYNPVVYQMVNPCDCTCRGPDTVTRNVSLLYNWWEIGRIGVTTYGVPICFPNIAAFKDATVIDRPSIIPVQCRDILTVK